MVPCYNEAPNLAATVEEIETIDASGTIQDAMDAFELPCDPDPGVTSSWPDADVAAAGEPAGPRAVHADHGAE